MVGMTWDYERMVGMIENSVQLIGNGRDDLIKGGQVSICSFLFSITKKTLSVKLP